LDANVHPGIQILSAKCVANLQMLTLISEPTSSLYPARQRKKRPNSLEDGQIKAFSNKFKIKWERR
jgi:hypothetical protein